MVRLKDFATVGAGTAVSRILGFIRDIAIAAALGAGPVADSFVVAFRLPNLFRRIFTEGAFNSAFIPAYHQIEADEGSNAAKAFAAEVFSAASLCAIIIATVLIMLSGWLVVLLAPGFEALPQQLALAAGFSRITLIYLPLAMSFAVLAALLNAHHRFGAMAFAPNISNIVMILVITPFALGDHQTSANAGWALSWAVTLGGFIQLALVVYAAKRAGLSLPWVLPRFSSRLGHLFIAAFSGVMASSLAQVNMLTATIVASLEASAVSWLYYADRVYQLPLGIVSVAIGVVLLPTLSAHRQAGREADVQHALNQTLVFGWMLSLPAAVALFLLAQPICAVLFQRGAFSARDAAETGDVLAILALSLPFLVSVKVLNAAFFANKSTKMPFRIALFAMMMNGLLAYMLFKSYGPTGIAWAGVISALCAALMLGLALYSNDHIRLERMSLLRVLGVLVASLGMGAILMMAERLLTPWLYSASNLRLIAFIALIALGLMSYALLIVLLKISRIGDIKAMVRR